MAGYWPTPLHELPELATSWGVGRVLAKHEANRFGLPSFKILGASWGVYQALRETVDVPGAEYGPEVCARLARGPVRRLVTATDGNHGRAVAWMARFFGLESDVFLPESTSPGRVAAIRDEGAAVQLVPGDYDRACGDAAAWADAAAGRLLVQDTYTPGRDQMPRWITEGYSTVLHEVDDVGATSLDVVFVPAGVGSFANAVADHHAAGEVRILTVEPSDAACVLASIEAGRPTRAPGPHRTSMAGLNCGTVSEVAWPLLRSRLDGCSAVTDAQASAAARLLDGHGIRTGATGAAAAAGAALVCGDPAARAELGIGRGSTLLLLITEGVTDLAGSK